MFRNGIAWSLRLAPRHVNTLMAAPIGLSETTLSVLISIGFQLGRQAEQLNRGHR